MDRETDMSKKEERVKRSFSIKRTANSHHVTVKPGRCTVVCLYIEECQYTNGILTITLLLLFPAKQTIIPP